MANRTLGSVTTIMKLDNSAFKKGLSNSKKDVNKFSGGMKNLGATIGGAFAIRSIARFTLESSKLAATMEGVAKSFDRIKPNIAFLDQLKAATAGTVSELDLMRRSVMASNFKIPLDQLASLLKFATKRAQETGESVEYLVNSIVIGIGRKSPLILDNLGISAVELRQKLEGVGHSGATVGDVAKAVGEIATESLKEMGDVIETTAIKYERLNAEVTNFKVDLGNAANEIIVNVIPALTGMVKELGVLGRFMKTFWEGGDVFTGEWDRTAKQDILDGASRTFELIKKASIKEAKELEKDGLGPTEALVTVINQKMSQALNEIIKVDSEWREVAKNTHKELKKWKGSLEELTSDSGTGSFNALSEELKKVKENWGKADLSEDIIKWRLEIIRLTEEIKKLQALGVPLPKVKAVMPADTDADMPGIDDLTWERSTETWIENLRRR